MPDRPALQPRQSRSVGIATNGTRGGTSATVDGKPVVGIQQVSSSVKTDSHGNVVVNVVVWGSGIE